MSSDQGEIGAGDGVNDGAIAPAAPVVDAPPPAEAQPVPPPAEALAAAVAEAPAPRAEDAAPVAEPPPAPAAAPAPSPVGLAPSSLIAEAIAAKAAAAVAPANPTTAFRIALPNFEGPLDLLLHLIREHKIDIFDIPISLITEKYLDVIKAMKELDLDIAGEFLLMAATLAHIKSRMLLPNPEPQAADEDQTDPREELVRRLLEYQKYKAAGEELGRMDILDREVFTRRARMEQIPLSEGEVGLVEVSVFKLVESLDRALRSAKIVVPHQVIVDRISLGDAITTMVERLKKEPRTSFFTVLEGAQERQKILVTFLALLEMCKLGLIRIFQEEDHGDILISAKDPEALTPAEVKDDYK